MNLVDFDRNEIGYHGLFLKKAAIPTPWDKKRYKFKVLISKKVETFII